ncbi:hypothetical protein [Xanthomonas sp. GPE 39]|uniref:hypothetical protein n=1 Tax=Xanthomonas sp. GPE 39 TaxID=1583099 RepID=UPI000B1C8A18|nr:hypothetical protein [Xanthomonas sp. GPE 39]
MTDDVIELEALRVRFYSANDESAFFDWAKKIPCIEKCEGHGPVIYLRVSAGAITENCLRELLSLFRRYEISMQQLYAFDQEKFSTWFRDKRAYWYASIFEV